MGGGSYTTKSWGKFSASRGYDKVSTRTEDIFSTRTLDESLDPLKFDKRESVDSGDNLESTPIIIGLDVTGSMAPVLDAVARHGLKTVCEEIYKRNPVSDPHICTLGIGDVEYDRSPFQATQFEADVRIFEALEKLYLEQGGGGNNHESYTLAWYFAKYRTLTDSFRVRGRKGFIFTIGDEEITPVLSGEAVSKFLGDAQVTDYTADELYNLVHPEWNVYHIIIKQGSHARVYFDNVMRSWSEVIGQRAIPLEDYTKLGEVIVSLLEVSSGKSIKDVTNSWDGSTAVAVDSALKNVTPELVTIPLNDAV